MPSPTLRALLLPVVFLTVTASLAACGDDSPSGSGDGGSIAPGDASAAIDAPAAEAGSKPVAMPTSDGAVLAPRPATDGPEIVTPAPVGDAAASPDLRPAFAVPVGPPPDVTKLCAALCDRLATCDTTKDAQTCAQSCVNTNAALVAKLRGDVLLAALGWAQTADCRAVLDAAFIRTALGMAGGTVAASPAVTAFCDGYFKRADECLGSTNKMDCLGRAKIYSDDTIAAAAACLPKACGVVSPCVQATLSGTIGAESLGGGVAAVTRCMGMRYECGYHSSLDSCNRAPGCTGMTVCSGTPRCNYFYSEATCKAEPGCSWNAAGASTFDRCTGTPTTPCEGRAPAACTGLCSNNVRCMGTATPCDKLSIAQCPNATGCTISDGISNRAPF